MVLRVFSFVLVGSPPRFFLVRIVEREGQYKAEQKNAELKAEQGLMDRFNAKGLKTRMSTKMFGETLEVYCSTEFNRVRASMYPVPILCQT